MPNIDPQSINASIQVLKLHLNEEEIMPLLSALEALQQEPGSDSCYEQLSTAFNQLGARQGAVLTYAPYLMAILSDDPFDMLDSNP